MSRKYYNNGEEQGLFEIGEQPEGWELGKLQSANELDIEEINDDNTDNNEEADKEIQFSGELKSLVSKIVFRNPDVSTQKGKIIKHF